MVELSHAIASFSASLHFWPLTMTVEVMMLFELELECSLVTRLLEMVFVVF